MVASIFQRAIATIWTGGPLMVPIAIVAFAIWIVYFVGYVRLRRLRLQADLSMMCQRLIVV